LAWRDSKQALKLINAAGTTVEVFHPFAGLTVMISEARHHDNDERYATQL
jgi:hypothetical protein